jgi:predicted acetyltransferase
MIKTNRLIIIPLTGDQLKKYVDSPDELAGDLGLVPSTVLMPDEVKDAIRNDLLPKITDKTNDPLYHTMWLVVEKKQSAIIGGICFHGEPDENGEVEIGYGTDEPFQNRGYMSETIAGFIHWIDKNKKARVIKAETESNNIASIRVLEKNGFKINQQTEGGLIFKLELK